MFGVPTHIPQRTVISENKPSVTVYGTNWCAKTMMVCRFLDRVGIPYRYVDLDQNPQAVSQLRWLTGGYASHPTVAIGGEVLVEPTMRELQWTLAQRGLA